MPTEANTTPEDVNQYIETDLTDAEITEFINDAEAEALSYNAVDDFREGELDRLVKFYAGLLITEVGSGGGGDVKAIEQGSRRVTKTSPNEDRSPVGWLRARVRANDPSGQLLSGRGNSRTVSFSNPPEDPYEDID